MRFRNSLLLMVLLVVVGCSSLVRVPDAGPEYQKIDPAKAWAQVLSKHVDKNGKVDFVGLSKAQGPLLRYVNYLKDHGPKTTPQEFKSKQAKLAHYINSYNGLAMYNILHFGIPQSLESQKAKFFYFTEFEVDGQSLSLYEYENDIIRKEAEPRVHFALNCMSGGCPKLPNRPFTATKLDSELEREAKQFFNEARNVRVDASEKKVYLSEIMDWYKSDFEMKGSSVIDFVNKFHSKKIPADYKVEIIPYSWSVISQGNPPTKS